MPCESLDGAWETGSHSRARGGCHVSALSGSGRDKTDGKPWYYDILQYLKDEQYPEHVSENDKRTLRRLAVEFFLDRDILYKRGKDQVLLRCVDSVEARRISEEVHEGVYGTHASGHMMARQIMRAGYY